MAGPQNRNLASNRKAFHDYYIEERFEAGIALSGTEVKSARQGTMNLVDSYCVFKDGEIFVRGMHISPYEKGNIFNRDPLRARKLLMHKREIIKLHNAVQVQGYALIPINVYLKGPLVKVEIALAKGKKLHDKREASKGRDADREMDRALKDNNR